MFRCRAVLLYECVHHNLFVYMQVFSAQNSVFCVIWYLFLYSCYSGFGGLGVVCWPLVPKFAGSNPAEALGFLRAKKSSARLPSEGK